ncbi:PAS domain S-box-containing protein [Sedimentibacter acidaminivorans]|uniref:HTH-type transcriptional regulatory protein TyrR n=1 Tax=Sedimentibacter acidaminivorans TaxID=913099 RepID=A0ABS4GI83_9FIRM|nr:sigma 54-interacting transcriptional regulator [Sedimentibacter acidaminivorans]MBP1927252.1 PAS domain S-box-containing protein [Sedimentibacter acidaminivorans]
MGDELKIKKIVDDIDDIYNVIKTKELSFSEKILIDDKYSEIKDTYADFINNYLDFKEISDNLYDGMYISNGKGKTIYINKAYTKITGITKEEVIGRTVKEITEEGNLFKGAVTMEVIERKEGVNSLGKSLKNNKDLLVSGSPIFDQNGNIKLVVINNRDISDLKELELKIAELNDEKIKATEEIKFLRKQQISKNNVVYKSENMNMAMDLVSTIGPTDVTVLITGESGTGKEVIADEIYFKSNRENKPFIKVNCAAIPAELLESELFGYEGGAFTDAKKRGKIGLFELANEGTILLDEIGDMSLNLQSKLLRVLQSKEIVRIGGNKPIKLDIRLIASTNKDLQEEIKKEKFREDLYYRLNVVPIELKPLRERKEDIYYLTNEYLNKYNKKYGKKTKLEKEAMKILEMYKWPGNIRELKNLIERMVVINKDGLIKYNNILSILDMESVSFATMMSDSNYNLKASVKKLEKDMIVNSIKKCGSVNKAAKQLGLSQPALWKKCKVLDIDINKE